MILKEFEVEQLGDLIRGIVRDEFSNFLHTQENTKEFIRRKEARRLLGGITDPTIISYEKRGFLHPIRIGGTILYDKEEILQTAEERKQR